MIIYSENKPIKYTFIELITTLLVNAFVLYLASKIFKGFFVSNYIYAIIAAIVIMILNKFLKPILKVLTLPINIFTLGLSYPIINVIILKVTGLIIGNNFKIEGIIVPFFIAIFISIMNIILDLIITKKVVGVYK